ncbi:MAG: hypothetical protein MUC34_08820 [Anaerolineae bacterium]|nr:hypothetical protein [Anaerolineae bacterium]
MSRRPTWTRVVSIAILLMLLANTLTPAFAAEPLGGANSSTLAREPQLTPAAIGDGTLDGLQFPDPTESLALVEPPAVSSDGAARLAYPLLFPKGRGIAPDLALEYDSGGGNGWLGQGWDLSAGEISVDTRWGAPYFDPNWESETYLLNGEMLIPNSLGAAWEPRLPGDRQDYTRQVEREYQQIIRHETPGEGTKGYFWEVHDKGGNVYWYGGLPDQGGPDGYNYLDEDTSSSLTPTIDRSAIVTDEDGNGVRWLLSARRDVGVNQITYGYTTIHYTYGASGWVATPSCASSADTLCARHTYLSSINYTEAADVAPAPDGDAQYQVVFLRESQVNPGGAVRSDPIVDAMGGYVDLTNDRLARIEVRYGPYTVLPDLDADGNEQRPPRAYNQLAVRYDLAYTTGPFGKSLLSSVSQIGSDQATAAAHTFTYYDRVKTGPDSYDGFAAAADWNTGSDLPDRLLLDSNAAIGALGSSESNSGEGHAYIGFNPISGSKIGSFGGSLQIGGGATEAIAEWLDINGDGLADKVYRDSDGVDGDLNDVNRNGPIRYRLNQGGPGGSATFGDEKTVTGITKLSTEGNFGIEGAFQAFPGVTVAFGLGAELSWGEAYFSDVNADGLPDYVSGGQVWFNRLDGSGVPLFEQGSANTLVPIEDASANIALPQGVQDIQAQLTAANPLVDTLRRWTAPFGGTISIVAPVSLNPAVGDSSDGVRVAIQHEATEIAAANLLGTGSQAFTGPIARNVAAGEHIYFRLGSINNGANDEVEWSPTITYTAIDGIADVSTVPTDVNGLSQTTYIAGNDFVLSGRPDTLVFMPYQGTVRFTATLDKLRATTDDLQVRLIHNGSQIAVADAVLPAAFVGQKTVTADFNVAAPVVPTDPEQPGTQDYVTVKLVTDTPVDIQAVTWNPTLAYLSAIDRDGQPKDLSKGPVAFNMAPEVEFYPNQQKVNSSSAVSLPWSPSSDTTRNATVVFNRQPETPEGTAVVSVKTRDGVIARGSTVVPLSVGSSQFTATVALNAALVAGTDYWFDVSIRDAALSDKVSLAKFILTTGTPADDVTPPATLVWTGRQGIFPLAYRSWAVAGYNGDGDRATQPINEADFVIDTSNFPDEIDVPEGFNDPDFNPPEQDKSYAYLPATELEEIPGQPTPMPTVVWVGNRANLAASAARMRSSRLGADTLDLGAGSGGSGRAVTRISVTAPSAKLAFGVGPLGASFGVAPSFGLVDYMDMNGDGYPDIVTPGSVTYTTPRGGYLSGSRNPGQLDVTNQDLTFALGVGFEQGLVDITANAKGKTNATKGGSAGKGGDSNDSGGGVGIGVSFDASWTSPNASGPADSPIVDGVTNDPQSTYGDQVGETGEVDGLPGDTAPIQLVLTDVNGDGLPDRVFTTPNGVFARYNLGYRFASAPVKLATGGFESQESYAGGLSLGFSTPWADFSGGVSLNWNVDLARYSWIDVNGDGILDQVHKISNSAPPSVAFGTGTGVLAPVTYGQMASAQITDEISAGQQASLDRSTGLGGQFDFTVGIGPLCIVACYLIINPGASYQNSISSTEVDLQDVNGDGYADSLQTLDDDKLVVRENKHADTNLLATVSNPLGGTYTMTYARDGNTTDYPDSVWSMVSVEVNDGRPGDGVDVRRTTYAYEGLKYDRLHRSGLGYATVTETEIDTAANPQVALRQTLHEYLNANIFVAGLETRTEVIDPANGGYIKGARQTWVLRDVRGAGANLNALNTVASLGYSIAPLLTQVVSEVGDGTPGGVGQSSTTNLTYSDLGDVIRQADLGEDDDPNDDVVADYTYSRCDISSTIGCAGDQPHDRPSPIWSANLCPTWVSLPAVITISNGKSGPDLQIYRQRDGRGALCDNASVTHLEETIGNGQVAETELTYDAWGSYDRIVYPLGQNGRRYAVQYVWDLDGHANIGQVTEYDLDPSAVDNFLGDGLQPGDLYTEGLTSVATFDTLSNRVATRTDANGNVVNYTYDALGRLASVSSPVPTDPQPLVTFEYFVKPNDPHAVARHYDAFHPGDTIDTAAFADGVGRVVQTQSDATLYNAAGQPTTVGMIVSGATFFDALGRPYQQYNPTRGIVPLGTFETNSPLPDTKYTETVFDLWDLPNIVTAPGNRVTTIAYEYGQVGGAGPVLYRTTETAPNGRQTVTYTDFRDVVRAVDDVPVGAAMQRTLYRSDGMGQLLQVVDPNNFVTTHTYDTMGRRTSTSTPDGGLVEYAYDADGQLVSKITPNLRAGNAKIEYRYDLHRLTAIDYPGTADDVSYAYGPMGAPDNGAGQVVRQEDGSRIQINAYDPAGNIVTQATTMKLHNWTPAADQSQFTWTTRWEYDGLRRLKTMVYPDSERLTYGYDAGGLVNFISGEEDGYKTIISGYDAEGQPIYTDIPWTWPYEYLRDRQYDEFLRRRLDIYGNSATTELTYDPNTQWLTNQVTFSPNRPLGGQPSIYTEIQDLAYTYDAVGNPKTYRNNIPDPTSSLFSGPTSQTYTYDPYERLASATGEWKQTKNDTRKYTLALTYDTRWNVTGKNQQDWIESGKKKLTQKETTYSFTRAYNQPAPHQATGVGNTKYTYDANGNLTGILDSKDKFIREIRWDAADRMRLVSDGASNTEYKYDDSGQRAIERGPQSETAFVNPWVTVRSGSNIWKHIWAGNDRLGTQRDDGGVQEVKQYFIHKDLQGSANIVTDIFGVTFQHQEYFATGEPWVTENNTVFRTPYMYGGGYVDEVRKVTNFGARWYDQNRELFYSPDPVLSDSPGLIVSAPSLSSAYAFAGSNPQRYVDPSGALFTEAGAKAYIKANFQDARSIVAKNPALRGDIAENLNTRLPKSFVRLGLDIEKAELRQKRFKMIDDVAKPFVEINISTRGEP